MSRPEIPETRASVSSASDGTDGLDARIRSALAWCASRRRTSLTVAAPFELDAAELQALLEQPQVISAIALPPLPPLPRTTETAAIGEFIPADYAWRLPARVGRRIVYIGGRDSITARMVRTALSGGSRRIVYWDLDRWAERSIHALAVGKLLGKAKSIAQTLGTGLWRAVMATPLGAFGLRLQHERAFRRLLGEESRWLRASGRPNPRRVVIACPTLVAGGAERQIVNTAIGLHRQADVEIIVLVSRLFSPPGNDFFYQELVSAGIEVRELQSPVSSAASWAHHQTQPSGQLLQELKASVRRLPPELRQEVANLYIALRELHPAVLHAWLDHSCVSAGLAGLMAGVPRVILAGRNVSPTHFPYILQPYMRSAYHAMAARPETVFVNNSHGGAEDYARWLGVGGARFKIIYNGLDVESVRAIGPDERGALRRRHGIPDHAVLVGGMFRLSPEKRPLLWIDTLIRLVDAQPDVYGLLFGAGPMRPELEARLARAGATGRIRLAPPIKESETALAAFDVLLLTSRWEGTPNVVIEAQAVGTPVVVSGGGGAAEALAPDQTGLFVEHSDSDALAIAVAGLANDPALRKRFGDAGPAFVTGRFGLARMLSDTLKLYALGEPEARPPSTHDGRAQTPSTRTETSAS